MSQIQARIFCPTHGRLQLEEVIIRNGVPQCSKCMAVLEYGKIRPRKIGGVQGAETKKAKPKRKKKK